GTYACYPSSITYNQNTITIYREAAQRPDTAMFATSGNVVGRTFYRISSIDVKVGSARSRVYKLTYALGATSSRSLLSKIQMYGSDAIVDANGNVTSGTALPPVTFAYDDVGLTWTKSTNG